MKCCRGSTSWSFASASLASIAMTAESDVTPASRSVSLASATDFDGFRRACRQLWSEQIAPDRVRWHTADGAEGDLAPSDAAPSTVGAGANSPPPVNVPATFMALAENVVLHSDPGRFALLYRLLWRLQVEPGLRHDRLDPDWVEAEHLAQAVRHDQAPRSLPALRDALERCRECPIGEHATQAVAGEDIQLAPAVAGRKVKVAVIDTGVDINHEDLKNNL